MIAANDLSAYAPAVTRRPDLAPLEVDDVTLVAALTGGWLLGLVALLVLRLAGTHVETWWIQMCACGVALGAIGVRYCANRHSRLDAAASRSAVTGPQA